MLRIIKEYGAPSVAKWGGSDETMMGPWCKDCLSDLGELQAELDCDNGTTDMGWKMHRLMASPNPTRVLGMNRFDGGGLG